MNLGSILRKGKKVFAGLSGLGFAGSAVAIPFDEATALIVAVSSLITATTAGVIAVLESIAKVKGWIPLDAELD